MGLKGLLDLEGLKPHSLHYYPLHWGLIKICNLLEFFERRGVLGDAPYTLLPNVIISSRLVYTPLLINPVSTVHPIIKEFPDKSWPSMEYFIGVKSVKVNGQIVPLSPNLIKIGPKGNGGTKISTTSPYTVLQTSIYNAITKAFTKAISKVPRVGPWRRLARATRRRALGARASRPAVPSIELVLGNNVTWTIFGANSMVAVNNSEVLCLGFVDGGKKPRTSIVIGGHQIEDNLLEFDVGKSRVGFSSTLLGRQTTCANFNFTFDPEAREDPLSPQEQFEQLADSPWVRDWESSGVGVRTTSS
ncbi:hypothetical protein DH2020_048991 [Rehmannia glutinosa]|uniref:Peptidase A1 domain-containing protein n=1 Tax=Rehmannia glutinosa TaxID=99300 RepID=A0ABR0U425_REHGL